MKFPWIPLTIGTLPLIMVVMIQCCYQKPEPRYTIYEKKFAYEMFNIIDADDSKVLEVRNLDESPDGNILIIWQPSSSL